MKRFPFFAVAATVMAFTATVGAQGPKAGTTGAMKAHAGTQTTKTGGTSAPKGGAQAGAKKATASGQSASTKTNQGKSGKTSTTTSTGDSTETTTSTDTTAAADAPEPNAVSLKIGKNPAQLAKIQPQLDALGLTLDEATKGFRNQGQFLAALNAAKNRNLDFLALQEAMTVEGMSLGQAAKKVQNTPPAPEPPPADTGTTGTTSTTSTSSTSSTSTSTTPQ